LKEEITNENQKQRKIFASGGIKDFSLFLVLICNFFFQNLWPGEIMLGSIAHFIALIPTL